MSVLAFFAKGKLCIEVAPKDKVAWISEELCIGCGICIKKCPFEAIDIIKSTNSIAHAAKVARDIVAEAWKDVETSLPDTPAKLKLKAFADYLVEREI